MSWSKHEKVQSYQASLTLSFMRRLSGGEKKKLTYSLVNIIGKSGITHCPCVLSQMYFLLKMFLILAKGCTRHLLFVSGTL